MKREKKSSLVRRAYWKLRVFFVAAAVVGHFLAFFENFSIAPQRYGSKDDEWKRFRYRIGIEKPAHLEEIVQKICHGNQENQLSRHTEEHGEQSDVERLERRDEQYAQRSRQKAPAYAPESVNSVLPERRSSLKNIHNETGTNLE